MLPVLAVALWLRAGGAWDDYLQIQHGFVAPYVRLNTPDAGARLAAVAVGTWTWLQVTAVPILLAPLAFLRNPHDPGLRTRDSGLRAAAAAALALGVLSVWVQGKFFRYHWQPVLPWLSLLAAAGSLELAARLRLPRPILPAAAFGAALLWTACAGWGWYRDAALLAAGAIPEDRWLAHFESAGSVSSARTNRRLAAYVRGHTGSEDPILVWGFEPQVYHFSRRECPTRFFFNVPVAVEFTPSQWRQEMLADLDRSPPALILVARNDAIPWANGRRDDSLAQLRAWPDLWGRVERDYGLETEIGHFLVYRRRAEGGSPGK